MQCVRPQDVAKLAGRIPLAAAVLLDRCRGRMRELFGTGVLGIRESGLLRRVVRPAGDKDDTALRGKVRSEKVEEEAMPDVVDGEGFVDAVVGVGDGTRDLKAGVEDEGGEWGVFVLCILSGESADIGEVEEVQGEVGDVLLAEECVHGGGDCVWVGAGCYQDEVVGALSGDLESTVVAEAGGATGNEHGAGWGCHDGNGICDRKSRVDFF